MGKRSKRRDCRPAKRDPPTSTRPCAPATLPATTHPFYESELVPLRSIPEHVQRSDHGRVFAMLLAKGLLIGWSLGRKGTHISSKFETDSGTTDYLTSPDPHDDDYLSLAQAHVGRALEVVREEARECCSSEPPLA